ncbi:MAG: sulfatase [Planctomycetota bacterium]
MRQRLVPLLLALVGVVLIGFALRPDRSPDMARPLRLTELARDLPGDHVCLGFEPLPPGVPIEQGLVPLLAARFENGATSELEGISVLEAFPGVPSGPGSGLAHTDLEPPHTSGGVMSFTRPSGAACVALAVHPDTPYVLRARVQRPAEPGCAPGAASQFEGVVMVAELSQWPDAKAGNALALQLNDAHKALAVPLGLHEVQPTETGRLAEVEILFKSRVYTNAVVVGLIAGLPSHTAQGEVQFDDVTLTELPLRRFLAAENSVASDELTKGEPFSLRTRVVKLFADLRDALLLPPPARMSFDLDLPPEHPRLSFGYGVIEEARRTSAATVRLDCEVVVDGTSTTLLRESLECPSDLGWHDVVLDLERFSGKRVTIAFSTTTSGGDPVAVVGAPVVFSARQERPSIVLISLDTLRADHVTCYGYRRPTTPFLDQYFTRDGVFFTDAHATAPFTLPSHASIFTGQYPTMHQVTQGDRRLVAEHPHLADLLRQNGYVTSAFTGGGFVGYEYGFRRGFDRYSIADPLLAEDDPLRQRWPHMNDRAYNDRVFRDYKVQRALGFIRDHKDAPFFLFFHSYVVHNYVPPAVFKTAFPSAALFRDEDGSPGSAITLHKIDLDPQRRAALAPAQMEAIVDANDASILAADDAVRQIVSTLRSEGLLDHTIVVVLSDHGEEFREHGGLLHGRTLYEETLHVPLLLSFPGLRERGAIRGLVSHVDLAPTLLELAGLPSDPRMQGRSMLPLLRGSTINDQVFAALDADEYGEKYAIRSDRYKLIQTPSLAKVPRELRYRTPQPEELYDLGGDPGEQRNLDRIEPEVHAAFTSKLEEFRRRTGKLDNTFSPSDSAREQLDQLGYVGHRRQQK